MHARILPVILIVFSLAACSSLRPSLPNTVSFSSTSLRADTCPSESATVYACANRAMIKSYRNSARGLEKKEWGSGEVELVGGALGAAGVVASSVPVAAGGAVLFGGSEVLSNFYGIEKQTDAYVKAYHAASCLQTIAESLRPDLFKHIQDPPGWGSVELYALHHLNIASEKVDNRLFESLRMRAVSQPPNFSALQASIEAAMTAKAAVDARRHELQSST